jgi:electron transfer flavoprotein beta subunit
MKIAVCVNYVPDTASKININEDNISIDKTGIAFVLNPYDEYAIEEALKIKEHSGGETFVISAGSESNKEAIRKALAMGIDNGILLITRNELDSYSAAYALADEIKNIGADVVLLGKQSVDYDNSIVGQITAEILNYPCITVVTKLELDGEKVIAEREIEGGKEIVETHLPVVITAQKGLNDPRYASLKGIMTAKKKIIDEKPIAAIDNFTETISIIKPAPKQKGRILGSDKSAVKELVNLLHNEAKAF